jgi:hypothetical protein
VKRTGRSLRGGRIRSMHSRRATGSPTMASSMVFRVSASASPSRRASAATVARLRPFLVAPEDCPTALA